MKAAAIGSAFEWSRVPYGQDGRFVRGIVARCGAPTCNISTSLPVNCFGGHAESDPVKDWSFIARKLEARGWRIGKSATSHRCPDCFRAAKFAAIHKAKQATIEQQKDTTVQQETTPKVVAENTRPISREERRIIFEKLNDVYVDERVGYSNGWSDEKVAVNLGVPRAWVRLIRSENFGDEIASDAIRDQVLQAQAFLADVNRVVPDLQRLLSLAGKVEKSLAEISKVLK